MYHVEILRIAIIEMEDAYNWYELQVSGLGNEFISEIDHYIGLIKQNPHQFAFQFSGQFKFATLQRFPYRIVYFVNKNDQIILINSIFHTSRNPSNYNISF